MLGGRGGRSLVARQNVRPQDFLYFTDNENVRPEKMLDFTDKKMSVKKHFFIYGQKSVRPERIVQFTDISFIRKIEKCLYTDTLDFSGPYFVQGLA